MESELGNICLASTVTNKLMVVTLGDDTTADSFPFKVSTKFEDSIRKYGAQIHDTTTDSYPFEVSTKFKDSIRKYGVQIHHWAAV